MTIDMIIKTKIESKKTMKLIFTFLLFGAIYLSSAYNIVHDIRVPSLSLVGITDQDTIKKISKSEAVWKQELNAEEYNVLRQKGTERPFTGDLWDHHDKGTYTCRGCQLPLFSSDTKFDSGTGWPSFYQPIYKENLADHRDDGHGMSRTEVVCARCGGHLGHVFADGPKPTGLRYCMNSAALDFVKKNKIK